jgi:hypothetical protein
MARMRTIKPDFWTDGAIVALSPFARLLYIGTWNFALCDKGHVADDPMGLKLKVLPMDPVNPDELLTELIYAGRMERITLAGRSFLRIPRFGDHQRSDPRWKSRCPACALESPDELTQTHVSGGEGSRVSPELDRHHRIGIGGEGDRAQREALEPPTPSSLGFPSRNCPRHPDGSDAPCGACKDARLRYEAWEGSLVSVEPDPLFQPVVHAECPDHPGYPHPSTIVGCPACVRDRAAAA